LALQINSIAKSLRQIGVTGGIAYINWITGSRMLIIPVTWIFFYELSIKPMLEHSELMQTPLNLLEPFIVVTNNSIVVPIIIISYLLLVSDCPKLGSGELFILHRTGKINWLCGQFLFIFLSAATYLLAIFVFCSIAVFGKSFIANGWSEVTRFIRFRDDYHILYASSSASIIEQNLFMHSRPYAAAARSFLLVLLYLVLVSLIVLLFNVLKHRILGLIIAFSVVAMGFLSWATLGDLMWFFPMANSVYGWHNQSILAQQSYSSVFSYIYFTVTILSVAIMSVIAIRRSSIQSSGNEN